MMVSLTYFNWNFINCVSSIRSLSDAANDKIAVVNDDDFRAMENLKIRSIFAEFKKTKEWFLKVRKMHIQNESDFVTIN